MRRRRTLLALAVLALVPLLCSCHNLRPPHEAYVKADRERFDLIEPVLRALADDDPGNDPDLSGVNGRAVLLMLDAWRVQLEQGEAANR